MSSYHHIPMFKAHALCEDVENPDMWFPEPNPNGATNHYRVGVAAEAREICSRCPAIKECLEYSLKYTGLHGIWAGLDPSERSKLQDARRMPTIELRETLPKIYEGFAGDSVTENEEIYG